MASFTDHLRSLPGATINRANVNMDRLNNQPNSHKRAADHTFNDYNSAKRHRTSTNDSADNDGGMFFTDDDDDDEFEELFSGHVNSPPPLTNTVFRNGAGSRPANQTSHVNGTSNGGHPVAQNATQRQMPRQSSEVNGTTNNVPDTSVPDARVKAEESEQTDEPDWVKDTPDTDKVAIYIGKKNKILRHRRGDIAKSLVLSSYITDDVHVGAYIMKPQLVKADVNDFQAVLQYLHGDEYAPLLLEDPNDKEGSKILDTLKNNDEYAKELVRSGRLYVLAQTFQVPGMAEQVYRKINEVDFKRFGLKSLVECAGVVFNNDRSPADAAATATEKDRLEEWIIRKVAKNFKEIMKTQQNTFWIAERKTNRRMFYARVVEEIADQYRITGGKMPEQFVELE